jgi:hypothetical protein
MKRCLAYRSIRANLFRSSLRKEPTSVFERTRFVAIYLVSPLANRCHVPDLNSLGLTPRELFPGQRQVLSATLTLTQGGWTLGG